jgi:TRAP-type C4-dicarboxylate transport system substrate-binding protein
LFCFSLSVILFSKFETSQQNLDLSLPWSPTEFHTKNAIHFAEAVKAATDGRVQITVHAGAVLGIKGPDSLRAASDGIVPLVEMAGFQQVGSEPLLGLESLPFLINTQEELRILYSIMRKDIEALFERNGVKLIYIVPWPNQNIYTKKPLHTLADAQAIKIRSQDVNTTRLMREIGMTPLQLPSPDVVPALATGAIDATMTSTTTAAAQKYWEFLHHIYRSNHIWVSNMLVMDQNIWQRLTQEDQNTILSLSAKLEKDFWAISKADDQKQLEVLLEHGMEISSLPAELIDAMTARARPIWRDFVQKVPEARPILERYLAQTGRAPLDISS